MVFEFCLCFFADIVILLVSSSHDLQLILGLFAAKCEVVWIRISKSEARH